MLGWVVQTCFRSYEHFWSPCHQGNDLCKFCGIQHATSEVSFQCRGFLCCSMDGNHVEQRRQWFNMLFYEVFVKDWDQFWVWDVRAFVTCKRCTDWVVGWEHQTYCMGRALFRSSREKPSSQSPFHISLSVDARCLMRCECFNNKNRSRHRRSKCYQQGTTI